MVFGSGQRIVQIVWRASEESLLPLNNVSESRKTKELHEANLIKAMSSSRCDLWYILQVQGNELLVTPPREVVRSGLASIRAFLHETGSADLVRRTFVRLMFVGYQSAGKTKLNTWLQGKADQYVSRSTCGIDTASWEPGEDWPSLPLGCPPVAFSSWDFAGQRDYYALHRFFLSERALYLLLVDLSDPNFEHTVRENVSFWLGSLNKHTKGAIVRAVGTKVDLIGAAVEERRLLLFNHIKREEERVVAELKERVTLAAPFDEATAAAATAALEFRPTLPKTPGGILLSSLPKDPVPPLLEGEGKDGWADFKEGQTERKRWGREEGPLPITPASPGSSIRREPRALARGIDESATSQGGGNPMGEGWVYNPEELLSGLRSTVLGLVAQHERQFQLHLPPSYVGLWERVESLKVAGSDADLSWGEYRDRMRGACGFKSEENLKEATRLLHDIGVLLWYDKRPDCLELANRVFIRPDWVLDLLKPIVGPRSALKGRRTVHTTSGSRPRSVGI